MRPPGYRDLWRQGLRYARSGVIERLALGYSRLLGVLDLRAGSAQRAAAREGYLVRHNQAARESMASYRRLARLAPEPDSPLPSECFALFVGYSRSGHSLVAALLDAHPEIVLSHELHAVKHLLAGHDFRDVARAIHYNARAFHHFGRGYSGYDYRVPGQHQGRCTRLRVLGDKKANGTCRALLRHPDLVSRLERQVPVPIRFVHVIRNPWDNIASKALRAGLSLEGAAGGYLRNARAIAALHQAHPGRICAVHLDELAARPQQTLTGLLAALGLPDPPADYLQACADIVFEQPRRTGQGLDWPAQLRRTIQSGLAQLPHLQRYSGAG